MYMILTEKIKLKQHLHFYADLHFCYLFKNNSVHTHDFTNILSVWQFDKTTKIKSTYV